jgi:hypothetical protein
VPALQRALAFAEVDDVAVRIGHDLEFDVAGVGDQLLQVDVAVPEGGFGLAPGGLQQSGHPVGRHDLAHSLAAAAGGGLDQQREADGRGDADDVVVGEVALAFGAGDDRDPGRRNRGPGDGLVSHGGDGARPRADEAQSGVLDGSGEILALGQEAITGMDGARLAPTGDVDDVVAAQVRVARRRRADGVGFVGQTDVQRRAIGLGVDRHRLHPELAASTDDADGDLASVGDQDLLEHRRGWPSGVDST